MLATTWGGTPMVLFGRLAALGLRRLVALYLLLFFGAVVLAPHQHANSIEDLISDGPSAESAPPP